jgi:hypothetical protein
MNKPTIELDLEDKMFYVEQVDNEPVIECDIEKCPLYAYIQFSNSDKQ